MPATPGSATPSTGAASAPGPCTTGRTRPSPPPSWPPSCPSTTAGWPGRPCRRRRWPPSTGRSRSPSPCSWWPSSPPSWGRSPTCAGARSRCWPSRPGWAIVATGLLALAGSGDWLLASIFFVVGRIGFGASLIFSDALLPHVAREEDQDRVSSLGYALGYLGGGILLAINAAMILFLGEIPGSRLSFLSVAVWWAVFTIPVLRRVPEPPAATARTARGRGGAGLVPPPGRHLPAAAPVPPAGPLPGGLPHLLRRHRHDHRGGRHLRGGTGLRGHRD